MNAEIIAIGSEMLAGDRIDTNSLYLTAELNKLGVEVVTKCVIGDDRDRLAAQVRQSMGRSPILILSGGLGPTASGSRVRLAGGKITVTDGPFTEAKEVFGGYAVFELKSKEEAVERTRRVMELHHKHWPGWEGETEVRPMFSMLQQPAAR